MAKPSTTHRVARYLERQIRTSRLGDPLPSVRQVMKTCRVSPQTVATAVNELERQNWLEIRPKSGLYRSGPSDAGPAIDSVDVLYFNADEHLRAMIRGSEPIDTSFHGDLVTALKQVTTERKMELRVHITKPGESDADMTHRIADDPGVRACMIVSLIDPSLVEVLNTAQIDYVNLFPAGFILPPNAITSVSDDVVGQQIEALVNQGHQRIAYLHTVEEGHYHRDSLLRREGFYRLAIDYDITIRPGYVAFGGYHKDEVQQAAEEILRVHPRPTGLICSDGHLPYVYEVAKRMGLEIGRDLSVVGTDDREEATEVDPPASTVRVPRRATVEQAFDLLDEVSHGRTLAPNRFLRVNARLIARQSIGPVNSL